MISDILLHPGEIYFGDSPNRIKTVLGSCVAVTVWRKKICKGGMCHFLLDKPPKNTHDATGVRYGKHALEHLYQQMCLHAKPDTFDIGVFGGSSLLFGDSSSPVGEKNVACALDWASSHGLSFKYENVLGNFCRTLILDLNDGTVLLKRYRPELEGA